MKLFNQYYNSDVQFLLDIFSLNRPFSCQEACEIARHNHAYAEYNDYRNSYKKWLDAGLLTTTETGELKVNDLDGLQPFAAPLNCLETDYLSAICRKSAHMTELVNKLLAFSRLGNDSFQLTLQKTDFSELARSSVIDCYDAFEKKGMSLEADIPDDEIILELDPAEIRRVLQNLLNNSIVHNPPGTDVHVTVGTDEKWCTFEICDNGRPIPPEIRDSIFEPFVCGDQSRQSRNGSGLGLSICRKAAQRHGGDVFLVEEAEGEKCFVLRLPL